LNPKPTPEENSGGQEKFIKRRGDNQYRKGKKAMDTGEEKESLLTVRMQKYEPSSVKKKKFDRKLYSQKK